jgi:protein-S-isoprenylcysteine O-methyltransferase Ste14
VESFNLRECIEAGLRRCAATIVYLLGFPSPHNLIIYSAALAIQIAPLLREERLLKRDPRYQEYMKQVPYRLIPKVF